MEDQILWAVTVAGLHQCGPIAAAIGVFVGDVGYRLDLLEERYLLSKHVVDGMVSFYARGKAPKVVPPVTPAPAKPMQKSGILPGESWHAYQHRKAFEAAEAAKPSRFSQHSQAN